MTTGFRLWRVVVVLYLLALPNQGLCGEGTGTKYMTAEKLHGMVAECSSLWLVDVGGARAFGDCHIEGAINIPLEELKIKSIPVGNTVVLVDDSPGGMRAEDAADILAAKGHERAYVLVRGLYGWGRLGYPLAGKSAQERMVAPMPVTPAELKSAIARGVQMKLYDLRDAAKFATGNIAGSEPVAGATIDERLKNLAGTLSAVKNGGLAARLKEEPLVVLVFSAEDGDAYTNAMMVSREEVGDIRYLLGGYEAMTAVPGSGASEAQTGCPTCPGR